MKRILSLMLCAVMLCGVLASCTTLEDGSDGMVIDVYMASEQYDFDPTHHIVDSAMTKILDMIYEGLTDLDENGKWKKALMADYEVRGNDEDGYYMLIDLNLTKWSDGRTVQAADFVYAWKRILDPEFRSDAAALLFDIKNAYEVKLGDASIDDLGVAAVDTYTLQIDFTHKIDEDAFLTKLASPALVPLREDVVNRNEEDWARQSATLVTNGPFAIKELIKGESMRIERSNYYYLDAENETQAKDAYVIPYKLTTRYSAGDMAAQLAKFEAGESFYMGEIPLASRAQYKEQAVINDELATHTYVFNTTNKLFSDARVRQALSMALDRNAIVDIVTYAKAATGLIPGKVFDADTKTFFRTVGGDLISASADVAGAKSQLQAAGVTSGSFSISIRPNEVDRAIAEYVKGVWESLGFKVTVKEIEAEKVKGDTNAHIDTFEAAYAAGDFDVIAIDYQILAPEAFSALAPFATSFSGNGVDMASENYDLHAHITGYASEEYNALIESAYAENDIAAKTAILHDAEKLLMTDMPVIPLIYLQDAYLTHEGISGVESSYFATREMKRMELKDYVQYLPEEELLKIEAAKAEKESAKKDKKK